MPTTKLSELQKYYDNVRRMASTSTNTSDYVIGSGLFAGANQMNSTNALPPPKLLLAYRLGYSHAEYMPFNFLEVARLKSGKYVVFIVREDEYLTIEDDGLFPSDKLVHQLTLLKPGASK